MSEFPTVVRRAVRVALLACLGACAVDGARASDDGASDARPAPVALARPPAPPVAIPAPAARLADDATSPAPRAAGDLPSWLDDAHPERQLDVLPGHWTTLVRTMRASGLYDRDGPLAFEAAPLLGGRACLGVWSGTLGEHEASGLDLLAYDRERLVWTLVRYWPAPGDAGFEFLEGAFRHGRLELVGQEVDAKGKALDLRSTLCDISPVSLRWEREVSSDDAVSWRTPMILELLRADASPAPDLAALLAREGGALVQAGPDQANARLLLGRWTGRVARLLPDGRWVEAPCRYAADALFGGTAVLDRWHEDAGEAGPALERVGVWGHLRGGGRRADRRSWEMFRLDDRSGRPWSFVGDFRAEGGDFVHFGERGRAVARLTILHPSDDVLSWVESSTEDGGQTWTMRVRVDLSRQP